MTSKSNNETRFKGLALSEGRAVGKVCMFNENRHSNLPMYRVEGEGVDREVARVERAIEVALKTLEEIRNELGVDSIRFLKPSDVRLKGICMECFGGEL